MGSQHPGRWRGRTLAVVVSVVLLAAGLAYRRQVAAYVTHLKGSPTDTVAWVEHDPAPDVHLAVAGDVGESGARLRATAAAMARIGASEPYDAVVLLGDNVYPSGDPSRLEETVFGPFRAVLVEGGALLAVLGNHDVQDGNGPAQLAALGMEAPSWSRRYDDVLLVGLDSNTHDDPEQLAWLEATLAGTDATWKIVVVHHPPYSAGYQGSDHAVRETYSPVFARHGVQLVLSGHDHDYQRSVPVDGVTYVVTGAAARTRRTGEASFTAVSFSWHHFVDLAISPDHLVLRAVNQDLRVADEAVLVPAATFELRR